MSNTKDRVLSRLGARELSQKELEHVAASGGGDGGPRTLTLCTFDEQFGKDGDVNEC